MIETIAIPVLMKAIDFLFEESGKILQERRERRASKRTTEEVLSKASHTEPTVQAPREHPSYTEGEVSPPIYSKESALEMLVDEAVWKNYEAEVKHLVSLLEIYFRNYYLAKEQYAKFGSALVPPIVVNNLIEAENAIISTMEQLRIVLSKVYGREVVISEGN